MIDLIDQFGTHEKDYVKYITSRINGYYDSDCYKILDSKMVTMQDCADLRPAANKYNEWISSVNFPIVKERQLLRRAITNANFRADEIFSCTPLGGTSFENAARAELVLNLNSNRIKFKPKTLGPAIDNGSKFGTSVLYTYWKRSSKPEIRTVYNEITGLYERSKVESGYENAGVCHIGLRDYFQNPDVADPDESDFQGHIRRIHISDLVPLLDDPAYILENVQKAMEEARKGKNSRFAKDARGIDNEKDEKNCYIDIARFEGTINIQGNEEDDTTYIAELYGETIIRLSREDYDRNIRSYSVCNFDKRYNMWHGVSDSEYVVTHENYLNTLLGMTLDSAMRSMQQYVFFDKKRINTGDLNNIFRNNGFVPVDANDIPISQLVSAFQPSALDMSVAQYGINAVQQSIQQMSTKVDLQRQANQGGPANKTATAANIIAGQSDILESDLQNNFNYGIISCGEKQLIMLQQFLPDLFYVRPKPKEQEQEYEKFKILGDFGIDIHSTLEKNKQNELLRLQNLVTWWLNISANPVLANSAVNILPVIKDIWNKADVPSDEIMPSESLHINNQMVPSNPQMTMAGGGMVPTPPQQTPPQLPMPNMGGM